MPPVTTAPAYDDLTPSVSINVVDFLSHHFVPDLDDLAAGNPSISSFAVNHFNKAHRDDRKILYAASAFDL